MEELRRLREARGLSQRQLAERSGVGRVTIIHVESGQTSPNVETLSRLAAGLGVDVADFFPKGEPPLFDPDRPPVLIRAAAGAGAGAAANVLAGIDDHFSAIV